ncbi:MAG: ribonuclease P protein component [Alphaproteobacteria bacterium]
MRLPTLKKSSEFSKIRNKGDYFKSPYFNGYILKDPNEEKFILGLVASKKLGNAVERNRSKRRVREAIRTCSLIDTLQGVRFVLILKKTILKVPFIDLKQDIEKFLSHEK